jgi:hypothetical protein
MSSGASYTNVLNEAGFTQYDPETGSEIFKCKKFGSYGKYSCINLQEHRAEIRVFQATLKMTSFMSKLEFCDALASWTHPQQATGFDFSHLSLLSWLSESGRWKRYPYLLNYLRQPTFKVKASDEMRTYNNRWTGYLPKINPRRPIENVEMA